jgi:hypothetical protein
MLRLEWDLQSFLYQSAILFILCFFGSQISSKKLDAKSMIEKISVSVLFMFRCE